jgi:hypothetical protein
VDIAAPAQEWQPNTPGPPSMGQLMVGTLAE